MTGGKRRAEEYFRIVYIFCFTFPVYRARTVHKHHFLQLFSRQSVSLAWEEVQWRKSDGSESRTVGYFGSSTNIFVLACYYATWLKHSTTFFPLTSLTSMLMLSYLTAIPSTSLLVSYQTVTPCYILSAVSFWLLLYHNLQLCYLTATTFYIFSSRPILPDCYSIGYHCTSLLPSTLNCHSLLYSTCSLLYYPTAPTFPPLEG